MMNFTVAIRTFNSEKLLPNLFAKLKQQIDTEDIEWEIIIIDNNSKDNTAKVVQEYQAASLLNSVSIKYYFEPEQGQAFARHRAMKEAEGELVGFLDDDNLPHTNWVAQAYNFGQSHPHAGAYGGQVKGKFEVIPPLGFEKISRFFALVEGTKAYCYNHRYKSIRKRMYPPGAGIVIRKKAWLESVTKRPSFPQACEDIEFLFYLWQKGWEIWFNPEMEIDHFITKNRLEKQYLIRFFQENGLYRYQLRMLNYQSWQQPMITFLYLINDFRKMAYFYIKNRKNLLTDVVTIAEMQLLFHIFISPFYHWKNQNKYTI